MIGSRVTKRYAKALYELAKSDNLLNRVEADLKIIRSALQSSRELAAVLESPIVDSENKRTVLSKTFAGKIDRMVSNFLNLLIDKKRENFLAPVIEEFFSLLDEEMGIVRGELYAAKSIQANQLEEIKKRLDAHTGKDVQLTQKIDEELLGGFRIRLGDTVIDNSLKNQLIRLHGILGSAK